MNLATNKDDHMLVVVANGRTLNIRKIYSKNEQESFVHLCQEFNDVFSWTYDDLKGFDPSLFQHTIDLNSDAKHVRKKQRAINPKTEPMMRKELSKLIETNIIFPIKYSS